MLVLKLCIRYLYRLDSLGVDKFTELANHINYFLLGEHALKL